MAKTISVGLKANLALESQLQCLCIRIQRKDNTVIGLTTYDQAFSYAIHNIASLNDTISYRPVDSFDPSVITSTAGSSVGSLEIQGAFASDLLTDQDLMGGLYDDAEVVFFTLNPEDFSQYEMIEKRGTLGEVAVVEGGYRVEIIDLESRLKDNVGRTTGAQCDVAKFCDGRCKLIEADYTSQGHLVNCSALSKTITIDGTSGFPAKTLFYNGTLQIGTIRRQIISITADISTPTTWYVKCIEPFGFDLTDQNVFLVQGCDRTVTRCTGLNNIINYRGFPHLPGAVKITERAT